MAVRANKGRGLSLCDRGLSQQGFAQPAEFVHECDFQMAQGGSRRLGQMEEPRLSRRQPLGQAFGVEGWKGVDPVGYHIYAIRNMTPRRVQAIDEKINRIKTALTALGPLRPGSLSRQYHVCRKPGCRCQDPKNPRRHGPYYHLDYVHHGKKTTRFIRAGNLGEVRRQLATFKNLRRLVDQWITLSLEQTEILRQSSRSN